jgi:ribose 5-phosphate isomerase
MLFDETTKTKTVITNKGGRFYVQKLIDTIVMETIAIVSSRKTAEEILAVTV